MTKEAYLNYVMLTEPKRKWSGLVTDYVHTNEIKNWKEGFDFIVKWSISVSPSLPAFWLVEDGYAEPEWAMEVIEYIVKNKGADYFATNTIANWMVMDGHAPKSWYNKLFVEN